MQSAVFDPLLLAVNLHPTPLTWDLSIIGAFVLGAAAAYVFGRVLGLRVVPAVVGSAAFSLSGWFFLYSNNPFSRSYVFLPLLFLLVELALALTAIVACPRARRCRRGKHLRRNARSVVLRDRCRRGLRGGAPRAGAERDARPHLARPPRRRGVCWACCSPRRSCSCSCSTSRCRSTCTSRSLQQGRRRIPLGSPQLDRSVLPGDAPASPTVRNWFGVAVGISALAAVSGRTETKRLHAWLFLAFGVVLLVKIYDFRRARVGRPSAGRRAGRLPGVRGACRLVRIRGAGGDRRSGAVEPRSPPQTLSDAPRDGVRAARRLLAHRRSLARDRERAGITRAVWRRLRSSPSLAVAAVVLGSRLGRRWAASLLAVVIVAELLVLAPFAIYAKRADPYLTPGWMPLVRAAQGAEPDSRVFAVDGKLYPNTAGALGLQDIRALDALYVERYWRYVQTFVQPALYDRFTGSDAGPPRFQDNPMFDALGVRAVLSTARPARTCRRSGSWAEIAIRASTRTPTPIQRAWVVHRRPRRRETKTRHSRFSKRVRVEGTARSSSTAFDPRREAVVDAQGDRRRDSLHALPASQHCRTRPRDHRALLGSVTLRVEAACPGLLVLSRTPTSRAGKQR